jgi:hypothetical protein
MYHIAPPPSRCPKLPRRRLQGGYDAEQSLDPIQASLVGTARCKVAIFRFCTIGQRGDQLRFATTTYVPRRPCDQGGDKQQQRAFAAASTDVSLTNRGRSSPPEKKSNEILASPGRWMPLAASRERRVRGGVGS